MSGNYSFFVWLLFLLILSLLSTRAAQLIKHLQWTILVGLFVYFDHKVKLFRFRFCLFRECSGINQAGEIEAPEVDIVGPQLGI